MKFTVEHQLPRRVRLRGDPEILAAAGKEAVEAFFESLPGVQMAQASERTGSLLIHCQEQRRAQILDEAARFEPSLCRPLPRRRTPPPQKIEARLASQMLHTGGQFLMERLLPQPLELLIRLCAVLSGPAPRQRKSAAC